MVSAFDHKWRRRRIIRHWNKDSGSESQKTTSARTPIDGGRDNSLLYFALIGEDRESQRSQRPIWQEAISTVINRLLQSSFNTRFFIDNSFQPQRAQSYFFRRAQTNTLVNCLSQLASVNFSSFGESCSFRQKSIFNNYRYRQRDLSSINFYFFLSERQLPTKSNL